MPKRHIRRAGLVLGGFIGGLVLVAIVGVVYFRIVSDPDLAESVLKEIDVPGDAFELESLEGDSIARVALRDVEFRDDAGARVATAPLVRATVDLRSMQGDGPIELTEVVLSQPTIDFVQYANGETNFSEVVSVTAGGQQVSAGDEGARGVIIRNFRIAEGDIRWSSPYTPDSAASTAGLRLARVGGTLMRVRTIRDLELWAPEARFGGDEGWRIEVASASAQLTDPNVRVVSLAGSAEEAGDQAIRFALSDFRTESSSLTGEGTITLGGETPQFDVELRAAPLAFNDLRWFSPLVPEAGQAEGVFTLASRAAGRMEVSGRDLVVTAFDSRITGRFSALAGGDQPVSFWDTRLALDPLRLETLEQLGLVEDVPYTGEVRGTVASEGATVGEAAPLRIDLAANFVPEGEDVPTSTVFLRGPLTVGGAGGAVRLDGVEVAAQPLYLAALLPLAPEQRERLRGVVRGTATLNGTPSDLRVSGGDIAYEIGETRSRLTGLTLQLSTGDETRFTLDARAEPLALGTLSELFPAFPFRTATFSGPIHVEGTTSSFRIDTELSGPAGLIAVNGSIIPGTTLAFDLTGQVASFNTQAVLERPGILESPVTGRFAVAGNVDDLRFNVNLAQPTSGAPADSGRFALEGTFRRVGGEPVVDVAGDIANFNLGALIGRPALFPSRMTGAIRVAGGGREPYNFDLDLRGASGALDVTGTYSAGAIPSYQLAGAVEGLNLRHLPGGESLPQTSLNATLDVRGQGTTLETLAGEYRINATRSTIAGRPLEALETDISVQGGVATVRRLEVALAETRLSAEGTWGLTQPVATPLNFRLVSPNLARLAPFLPPVQGVEPQISGSVDLRGSVAGSMRVPVVDVVFHGDNLRYEAWRARELEFGLAATLGRRIQDITGELTLTGQDLDLAGRTALSSLSLGLEGGGAQIAVRAAAARDDDDTSVSLTGLLEMRGSTPAGVLLDSLTIRSRDLAAWQLTTPTTIRWGGTDGIFVQNLNLQRTGGEPGLVSVNGAIPPNGAADLRVSIQSLDLALFRQLVPTMPALEGIVQLDAVLEGPVGDPQLTMNGSVADFVFRDVAADSISLAGRYQGRVFNTNASVWIQGSDVATAEAAIPMQLTFSESLPNFQLLRTEPMSASIVADSLPVALLASSVPTVEDPTGIITTELTASGTVDRPALRGWAHLEEGAATFTDLGVRYDDMHGRLSFEDDLVRIDSLRIRSNGTAIASGTARLVDLTNPEIFLSAQMEGFHAINNDEVADLTMSGQVTLAGRMPRPVLTGDVTVDGGTIYFPDFGAPVPLELTEIEIEEVTPDTALAMAVGPGFVQNVQISDLNVTLEQGVWMEAPTARVEIRGTLVVFRSGRDMRLYGNLEAARGTYALTIGPIVREFDVTGGTVRFLGTPDLNPELDIIAEHEVRSVGGAGAPAAIAIVVRVTGTAEYPRVSLTSDTRPPLPESELLNYLVFGQPSFRLNQQGFAQQLVVQEILGGLLVQELAQLGLPCEYLRLRGRPTQIGLAAPLAGFGSTSVECGVQVLPDVFLTLETGIASAVNPSNPLNALLGVSLDWQVKDYLAARIAREPVRTGLGALFQSGDVPYQWSGDVNGTWEFGHPDTTAAAVAPPVPEGGSAGQPAALPPIPVQLPDSAPAEAPAPSQGAAPVRREESVGPP